MKKRMKKWLHFASCRRGEPSGVQHMFHHGLLLLLLSSAARATTTTTMWLPCCSLGEAKTIISSISAKWQIACCRQKRVEWQLAAVDVAAVAVVVVTAVAVVCCPSVNRHKRHVLQMKHSSCAGAALAICNSLQRQLAAKMRLTIQLVQWKLYDVRIPLATVAACHTLGN